MKIAILFISLFLFIIYPQSTYSQSSHIDSLENLLSRMTQRDTARVNLLNKTAASLQNVEPQRAFKHLTEAGKIAEELDYQKGMADYYDQLAMYNYVASEFDLVLEYANKSLVINQSIGNLKGTAKNYYYIGKIHYFQGKVDQATNFIKKALDINIAQKDSVSICYNYASLGTNYADIGNYDLALQYEKAALNMAYKIKKDEVISFALNNLGVVYEHYGNWPKALECYQKSFIIDERQKNYKDASIAASNIANIQKIKGNYSDAIEHCLKGLHYAEKVRFKTGLCYNYEYMAHIYVKMGDYDQAWEYQQETLALQKEIGNKQGEVIAYRDLGDILVLKGKFAEAMESYNTAISISKSILYKRTEISSYIGISTIYSKQNKHKLAYRYSKKAYLMATAIDDINLMGQSAGILAKSSEKLGLYKEAYMAHVSYKTMSDSLYNEENIRRISNLEYEYKSAKEKELLKQEQQKKDRLQAAELKKEKTVRNAFIFGFLFMIFFALIIWRGFIEKRKANVQLHAKNLEIKKQAMELIHTNQSLKRLSQFKEDMTNMIIHDLKNPLSTMINVDILSEVANKDELIKHLANEMLNMIENTLDVYKSESVEVVLNKEQNDLITIINGAINELAFIAQFNLLSFKIVFEDKIEVKADAMVLRRVFANLLSNAVKFSSKNDVITINADVLDNKLLKVSIHNNGSYISSEQQEHIFEKFGQANVKANKKMHSTGLGLTYCRMAIESHNGHIGVESSQKYGTTFWFTIPEAQKAHSYQEKL
ncbi:tetratricopeptide repeat-containing sensor histidine kinase [Carboxylicivirga sp. RSCT41]|uniref:tetratricopeptide repeat-containing sensor histidine kinase n=1 Tax=Carboxylicivirga agarovorans TaxID=3417570 RepID=UPI003D32556A